MSIQLADAFEPFMALSAQAPPTSTLSPCWRAATASTRRSTWPRPSASTEMLTVQPGGRRAEAQPDAGAGTRTGR